MSGKKLLQPRADKPSTRSVVEAAIVFSKGSKSKTWESAATATEGNKKTHA